MDDLWTRVRGAASVQDAVGLTANRVRASAVSEGKLVARCQMVLVLAGKAARLCEREVGTGLARPGQTRDDAVEDLCSVNIFVEALPQPVAQKAPRLRHAKSIDVIDPQRVSLNAQRIGTPLLVESIITKECNGVAHRGHPQPHYDRVARRVDEFVDRARVKRVGPVDLDRFIRNIAPIGGGKDNPMITLALAHGQRGAALILVGGGIAERRFGRIVAMIEDELVAIGGSDWRAIISRDWKAGQHPALSGANVALPCGPQHRVSL